MLFTVDYNPEELTAEITRMGAFQPIIKHSEAKEILMALTNYYLSHTEEDLKKENRLRELEVQEYMNSFSSSKKGPTNRPGYVYIMECEGKYKIGFSDNPQRRQAELNKRPFPVEIIFCKYFNNAYRVEKEIHKKYKKYNINYEWYELSENKLLKLINFLDKADEEYLSYEEN